MDHLGPFEQQEVVSEQSTVRVCGASGRRTILIFYPEQHGFRLLKAEEVRRLLPWDTKVLGAVAVEQIEVPREWEEVWREHFRPFRVGCLEVMPPWVTNRPGPGKVIINPGLAFGTGLHPTTRSVLELMQIDWDGSSGSGRTLVDVGTGSGILAIAGAQLGFGPIYAFDADPMAVEAASQNVSANGVAVNVFQAQLEEVALSLFSRAVVVANLEEKPVLRLLCRLRELPIEERPVRVIVSGILAGSQEKAVAEAAESAGLTVSRVRYEEEWATMDLTSSPEVAACRKECSA